jgi:hypothetical protein
MTFEAKALMNEDCAEFLALKRTLRGENRKIAA